MATLGKWWGRNTLVYKANPGWVPASYYPIGPYVYDKSSGKWWGLFGSVTLPSNATGNLIIREKFSISNLVSLGYQVQDIRFGNSTGLFVYQGYIYGIRKTTSAGGSVILFKVNPATGVASDVKTLYSTTTISGAVLCFDGVQTAYCVVSNLDNAHNYFLKYDIGSDTLTTLLDHTIAVGSSLWPISIGVDSALLYLIGLGLSGSTVGRYTILTSISVGGGYTSYFFAKDNSIASPLGYRGFYFFSNETTIQQESGSSFDLGVSPDVVFIDDTQGVANARFGVFYHSGGTVYFREYDGTTVKKTISLVGTPISYNKGVFAWRPSESVEEALSLVIHDRDVWWEARSSMKEIV